MPCQVMEGVFDLSQFQFSPKIRSGKVCLMAGAKSILRSNSTNAVKEIGIIDHLPLKPLSKKNILQRYNSFISTRYDILGIEKENIPVHNSELTEKHIVNIISEEIITLYKKFGLKPITKQCIKEKIIKIRREYKKTLKNVKSKGKLNLDEKVSFQARKQPRETLKEDIDWYKNVLDGSPGQLGAVDRAAAKREAKRLKQKSRSRVQNLDLEIVPLPDSDTESEEDELYETYESPKPNGSLCTSTENDVTQSKKRKKCRKLDWSPVVKVQC